MSADTISALRRQFRSFKRHASRLRDGLAALTDAPSLRVQLSWDEEKGTESSFDESAPTVRLAALLRPFMTEGSTIELRSFWSDLLSEPDLIDLATIERVDRSFAAADRLLFPLLVNNREMTARDIYFAYAEGEFFGEDPNAKVLLTTMAFMAPATNLVKFLFHNTCATYAQLALVMVEVVLTIEQRMPEANLDAPPADRCIYCLTSSGDFGPEEHVIPEAFGVDEMLLLGSVCKACNNSLSALDQFLAEFELLAMLRVIYVPLTKKGKLPHADFRDFKLVKVKPRVIRITNKTKRDVLVLEDLPDGTIRGSLSFTSRGPVDILRLARALFKIGLGLVAYDQGVAVACEPRFDAARGFVRGVATMPNHLVTLNHGLPIPLVRSAWQSVDGATGVELDFYGLRFALNLEPSPFGIPVGPMADDLQSFWLGDETKGGVVPPCGAACDHVPSPHARPD